MNDEANDIRSHIDGIARPISFAEVSDVRDVAGAAVRPARFRVAMVAAVVVLVAGFAAVLVASNRDQSTRLSGESTLPVAPSTEAVDVAETQPTESLQAPKPFADEFSARGVLGEIPIGGLADADGLRIGGTDLVRISELTGVARAGSVDLQDPPSDWLRALFLDRVVSVAQSQLLTTAIQETDEFEQDIGFSFIDVDRFASATNYLGFGGADQYAFPFDVVVLRSDVDALVQAAGDDGIIDVGSGADGEMTIEDRTPVRPVGRPFRVAVDASRSAVAISESTPFVVAWLDTDGPTMADEPDLAAAAEVLDLDDGLYSVRFEQLDRDLDDIDSGMRGDRPDDEFRIVEEFSAIGIGWSGIGETQQITIVYVFADAEAATASVGPIEALLAPGPDATVLEFTDVAGAETVDDVFVAGDVRTVGRSVVVTGQAAAAAGPQNVTNLFNGLNPLNTHR